jgi:hypothetical protein
LATGASRSPSAAAALKVGHLDQLLPLQFQAVSGKCLGQSVEDDGCALGHGSSFRDGRTFAVGLVDRMPAAVVWTMVVCCIRGLVVVPEVHRPLAREACGLSGARTLGVLVNGVVCRR